MMMMASFGLDSEWFSVASWSEKESQVIALAQWKTPRSFGLLEHQYNGESRWEEKWHVRRLAGLAKDGYCWFREKYFFLKPLSSTRVDGWT